MLDRRFNAAFAKCTTNVQRDQLRRDYVISRDNFWEARTRIFIDNDPLVKKISAELKTSNTALSNMLTNLQDIVKVLETISSGVKLGSSLILAGSNQGNNS